MKSTLIPIKFKSHLQPNAAASLLFLLILIFFTSSAIAESWYIKPSFEVPLRRGQGTDYKILAIVPDGTKVSIIEENDPWAKVVSEEGKEGWILKRYLSQDKPLTEVIESISHENKTLKEELAILTQRSKELVDHNSNLQKEIDTYTSDLSDIRGKYQTLTQDTADVMLIKNNLDQSKQNASKMRQELSLLSDENKRLKASQNIKWFLAGGGTLLFGCIIGMLSLRSRKRKSSLY